MGSTANEPKAPFSLHATRYVPTPLSQNDSPTRSSASPIPPLTAKPNSHRETSTSGRNATSREKDGPNPAPETSSGAARFPGQQPPHLKFSPTDSLEKALTRSFIRMPSSPSPSWSNVLGIFSVVPSPPPPPPLAEAAVEPVEASAAEAPAKWSAISSRRT